ncbi:MAG TPA: hypothetical protein VGJ26_08510 [Pirellulales bacterium]|jgi:hypothetical protein
MFARQMFFWFAIGGAVALALTAAPGCRPSTETAPGEHDHESGHDHGADHAGDEDGAHAEPEVPRDYRQAIVQVRAGVERIAKAIETSNLEAAHEPLDEIDATIGHLMLIAKQSGVPRGQWEEVNVARRALRAELDQLHAKIDANQRPDYAAAKGTIEDCLKRLQNVADEFDPKSPSPAAASDSPSEDAKP